LSCPLCSAEIRGSNPSFLKVCARYTGLANDRLQRSDPEFSMIRNWHSDGRIL
jgi:hypothetical protein